MEGRTEFLPPDPDRVPVIENSVRTDDPAYAARPADERTHELLSQMRPHRATLLGILAACEAPMATSAMKEAVERISGRKFSVHTPSNFCTMLEVADGAWHATDAGRAALAGALAKVVDDYEVPAVDDVTCANVPTLTDGVNW